MVPKRFGCAPYSTGSNPVAFTNKTFKQIKSIQIMGRKISLAKEIKVQRLQDKNRMVGETFNPTGITSEEIASRELLFINEMASKDLEQRIIYWNNAKKIISLKLGSWAWEWCAFKRSFVDINGNVK